MRIAQIIVEGEPQGKGRPRFTRSGHTYTPDRTREYERRIAEAANNEVKGDLFEGPLRIDIVSYHKIPKSASRALRERMLSAEVLPAKKPDIDNIAKAVLDALNGIAYEDDTQVVKLHVEKRYSMFPCVLIRISEEVS